MEPNTKPHPCPRCGLRYQCICSLAPVLDADWHLALLIHPNELKRETNSGKLLSQTLNHCQNHIWQRTAPPQALLAQINSGDYRPLLLFPGQESCVLTADIAAERDHRPLLFILLDATWQEARKMVNRSPWLQNLPRVRLASTSESRYALRRNQQPGNLCSCEVGIELLSLFNPPQDSIALNTYFQHYLNVFNADKSGHKLI